MPLCAATLPVMTAPSPTHALSQLSSLFTACLQLANVLSNESLFYVCIIPFIIFFGSFAFIMYPLRDQLHPTGTSCGYYVAFSG